MTDFSDPTVPLTEEAALNADRSGAPPVIYNHALFSRVYQLEQATTPELGDLQTDVNTLQADVNTLQAETASLLPVGQIRVPLKLTANGTWATYAVAPKYGATVTAIAVVTPTVFASTGGTVLLSAKKDSSSGNTLFNAATKDLETVTANTLTSLTLTATTADLAFTGNQLIYLSVVSNNADATGPADGGACLVITYTYTLD